MGYSHISPKRSYYVHVCPNCKSEEDLFIKIYTGTDGLFSSKKLSHYKCDKCQHEFKYRGYVKTYLSVDVEKKIDKLYKDAWGKIHKLQDEIKLLKTKKKPKTKRKK